MQRLRLVIPVYNDRTSFHSLFRELDDVAAELPARLAIGAGGDGSTHGSEGELTDVSGLRKLEAVEMIALYPNVGHQRAIAIGMATAAEDNFDAVLAMDAGDEDSPQAIAKLLAIAGSRQVLGKTLSSILMLLNSGVQRLIVPLADYKCFVDYREQILNSVKERLPVFEPAPLLLWEKLA